ncbi:hypothetical protein GCM10027570_48470 [Streptomonospora sediminis]
MTNPSGLNSHYVPATPHYPPQHTGHPPRPVRRRGRHRAARPYLARLPEPETPVLPAITQDTAPPPPPHPPVAGRHRRTNPRPEHSGRTAPADDLAELGALTRRLLAQRPDLAHPAGIGIGVRTGVAPR